MLGTAEQQGGRSLAPDGNGAASPAQDSVRGKGQVALTLRETLKGIRTGHPQICHLGKRIILN